MHRTEDQQEEEGKVVLKAAEWTEQCALPAEGLSLGFVVNTLTSCLFIAQPVQHTKLFLQTCHDPF